MQVHISYLDHFIEALYISWPSQPLPQEVRACASKPGACHWKGSENRTRSLTKKCLQSDPSFPCNLISSKSLYEALYGLGGPKWVSAKEVICY